MLSRLESIHAHPFVSVASKGVRQKETTSSERQKIKMRPTHRARPCYFAILPEKQYTLELAFCQSKFCAGGAGGGQEYGVL